MSNAEQIKRRLEEARRKSEELAQQEIRARQVSGAERARREEQRKREIEAKWRLAGVLGLFEELRDEGVVVMNRAPVYRSGDILGIWRYDEKVSDFHPAVIVTSEDCCELIFDERSWENMWGDGGGVEKSHVRATIDGGRIHVNGEFVVDGGLNEAVAGAIARAKGYRG